MLPAGFYLFCLFINALAKTYLLTSFGLCGWFLSDLAMCMAFVVAFLILINKFF